MAKEGRKQGKGQSSQKLHFDVSTGLKNVLGSELITNDEVAIFELVKNSFDAGADTVHIYFGPNNVIVADNGAGMSYEDLTEKWLFVAYSAKRDRDPKDFRNLVAERQHFAGSKGIGRFSSDRLGSQIVLQTRPKAKRAGPVHALVVDWNRFERDAKEHFEHVPVTYDERKAFELPRELARFGEKLTHGTIIEIGKLRHSWNRAGLLSLKASLAKLINPFGDSTDKFTIHITAPEEIKGDRVAKAKATKEGEDVLASEIVNGRVGNFIFTALQEKTTFISVVIDKGKLTTVLTDRGEVVYRIREPNPYKHLEDSSFRCEIYYLNTSAKQTFARRVGLPSVNFGSVFLFRNDFRVYPVGEVTDDWFGFDRRKQQGYSRFLGTREIIGRVDVYGSDEDFQEASSRNQGLILTAAVRQLRTAVMEHGLKRLEKYVVPVSWSDPGEATTEDISRLLTDPGRAKVSNAVASLVDNDEIELVEYSKRLVSLINERSTEFEASVASIRAIAEKTQDKSLLAKLDRAESRHEELKKSEAEARKIADRERAAAEAATERAIVAESAVEIERRRAQFLQAAVNVDASTILNLHHQVTIYAVDIAQQIENLLNETAGQKNVTRESMLAALEQMAFLNRKVLAITRFAAQASFKLDSEKIDGDLATFITEYIENIAKVAGSARTRVEVDNEGASLKMRFNPINVSILVDNLVSNARRAKATRVKFTLSEEKGSLNLTVSDNGQGLAKGADPERIFDMGYTTTHGSGLGLYHVRQVLGEMGGSIELDQDAKGGATFNIKVAAGRKAK